jgi:hypothetical protein
LSMEDSCSLGPDEVLSWVSHMHIRGALW